MILRVEKRERYVVLDKGFLNNPKLSLKEKGLLAIMLSKPNDWKFTEKELANTSTDGITAVRKAIQNLIKYGYIERKQKKEHGRYAGYEYIVRETPMLSSTTVCEKPFSENLKTENPKTENRTLLNNNRLNNEELNNELLKHKEYNTPTRKNAVGDTFQKDEVFKFVTETYPAMFEHAFGMEHKQLTPVQVFRTAQILRSYLQERSAPLIALQAAAEEFLDSTKTDGSILAFANPQTIDIMLCRLGFTSYCR